MDRISYKMQEKLVVFLFLIIPIVLIVTFTYYPAVTLICNSFTRWDGISKKIWVGLGNYRQFFSDPSLFGVLYHNIAYLLMGFVQIVVALFFAYVLNNKFRGRNFFKVIFFMPYIINSIAIAFMLNYVFDNQVGVINIFLRDIGLGKSAPNWIGDPRIVNISLAFMALWKYMGYMMTLFLGALQSISTDIYEASSIDGATSFQTFRYVTLPCIWKVIQLMLFLNLNGAIGAFEFSFAIYPQGSPLGMADTFVTKTIGSAFSYNQYGMASAMGIIIMLMTAVLSFIQYKIFSRKEE